MSKHKFIIKHIVNHLISEDAPSSPLDYSARDLSKEKGVSGDDTALATAKGNTAIDNIKSGLVKAGIHHIEDLDGLFTLEMLKPMGFSIKFRLREEERDNLDTDVDPKEGITDFNGRAKVNIELSGEKGLALDLDNGHTIKFYKEDQLVENVPSTNKDVYGVKEGKEYDIILTKSSKTPEEGEEGGEEKPEDEGEEGEINDPPIPKQFLKGTRDMQLMHLSKNFLSEGQDLWSTLHLKDNTHMPAGFFDSALGQGKNDPEKFLKKFHGHLKKNGSFTKKINVGAWLAVVRSNKNIALIHWVRNTRKGIGSFFKALSNKFPEFELGERAKGEKGEAMRATEPIKDSINKVMIGLLLEGSLGTPADNAGFKEDIFMKNLPTFIETLSMMYYGINGTKLPYNKKAVLEKCGDSCKGGKEKETEKPKTESILREEGDTEETQQGEMFVLKLVRIDLGYGKGGVKKKSGKGGGGGGLMVTGSLDIPGIDTESTSGWWQMGTLNKVNELLKSGLDIRKSESKTDVLILSWPDGDGPDNTDAVLIKVDDVDKVLGQINIGDDWGGNVGVGRNAGGNDRFDEDIEGSIKLRKKG